VGPAVGATDPPHGLTSRIVTTSPQRTLRLASVRARDTHLVTGQARPAETDTMVLIVDGGLRLCIGCLRAHLQVMSVAIVDADEPALTSHIPTGLGSRAKRRAERVRGGAPRLLGRLD
jgi:hypothetical protein